MKNKNQYFTIPPCLCVCVFLFPLAVLAQKNTEASPPPPEQKISWYGFVRSEICYNTRRNLNLREIINVHPLDHSRSSKFQPHSNEVDSNALPQLGLTAMLTRLGVKFGGLKVLGAKVSGAVDMDFFSTTTTGATLVRLRNAYAKLEWTHANGGTSTLIAGQYIGPRFSYQSYPITANLSGIPLSPVSRVPQFRYTYKSNTGLGVTGMVHGYDVPNFAAAAQGGKFPAGSSIDASKLPILPSFALLAHFENKTWFGVAMVEGYPLSPDKQDGIQGNLFIPLNFMLSGRYTHPWFTAKFYGCYGDLFTQYVGLGGFVGYQDSATSKNNYVEAHQWVTWADVSLTRHKVVQPALFVGYHKNMGLGQSINVANEVKKTSPVQFYGRGMTRDRIFDYLLKFAPRVDTYWGKLRISIEYEWSMMEFMNSDYSPTETAFCMQKNRHGNANAFTAVNHRFVLLFMYYF